MVLVVHKYIIGRRFKGMSLWPFILINDRKLKNDRFFMNHERIHLRQQAEMLVIPFYIWYYLEYLIRLIKYRDRMMAYRNISFEREAYDRETIDAYLEERKFWNFLRYL